MFVTGTLVLGDTLNQDFNTLIGTAYQHVSYQIRGKAASGDNDGRGRRQRRPQAGAAVDRGRVRSCRASPSSTARSRATRSSSTGRQPDRSGGADAGLLVRSQPQLSPLRLVRGHSRRVRRRRDGQVDGHEVPLHGRRSGAHADLPGPPQTFTISGIVTFGSDDNLLGETLAGFALPTAQRLFDSRPLRHDQRPGQAGCG